MNRAGFTMTSSSLGDSDDSRLRPDDGSGRYWSAPPCRVRVDDGSKVTWIDLKRPYALIGSHSCCTLRIRGAHVPEVAYFLCCLRDRVEIWPTAAIAFPRWGEIGPDLQVVLGPCSLTFHLAKALPGRNQPGSFLADCEIETRLSWPGQDFPKTFRRPVTVIGDDHPSVLRLHGRGLTRCHYAAVVQDESAWLVDLSARRMQRSVRVRRFHQPGETFQLGDAVLEFVSAKPRVPQSDEDDSGIGLGIGEPGSDIHSQSNIHSNSDLHSQSDIHSEDDIHSDDGPSGMSGMASGIHSFDPDPAASFISSRPPQSASAPSGSPDPNRSPDPTRSPDPNRSTEDANDGNASIHESGRSEQGDDDESDNPALCLSERKRDQSHAVGDDDFDSQVSVGGQDDPADKELDTRTHRFDSAKHGTPRPTATDREITPSRAGDASTTETALNLVDTALGLVDAAVHEPDSNEALGPSRKDESVDRSKAERSAATDEPTGDEPTGDATTSDTTTGDDEDPHLLGDVSLSTHDPPRLIDLGNEAQRDPPLSTTIESSQATEEPASEFVEATSQQLDEPFSLTDQESLPEVVAYDSVFDEMADLPDPDSLHHQETAASEQASNASQDSEPSPQLDLPAVPLNDAGNEDTDGGRIEVEPMNLDESLIEAPHSVSKEDELDDREVELPRNDMPLSSEERLSESLVDEPSLDRECSEPQGNQRMPQAEPTFDASSFVMPLAAVDISAQVATETAPVHQDPPSSSPGAERSDDASIGKSVAKKTASKTGTVDPEALTSHITTRLTEMGQSRSILYQVIRWTAITVGIVVPATVVAWVVHRIYSDWY